MPQMGLTRGQPARRDARGGPPTTSQKAWHATLFDCVFDYEDDTRRRCHVVDLHRGAGEKIHGHSDHPNRLKIAVPVSPESTQKFAANLVTGKN